MLQGQPLDLVIVDQVRVAVDARDVAVLAGKTDDVARLVVAVQHHGGHEIEVHPVIGGELMPPLELPRARIERMDADTMSKKNRFREVLSDFRVGKIDILVGTQMIGKGLDFPNVTLVGLIDADLSMHIPDFRANERTFQLLVQVAGRAGRGDRAGEVVVQTFTPQAEAIQFSRHADFLGFAESELKVRREFGYPPARHLIRHLFRGPNPEKLKFFSEQWAKRVGEVLGKRVELRGPAPASIEKIKDEYRWQLWYFTDTVTKVIADLAALRASFAWPEDMVQVLDVDPVNLG